jgi:hypothetical protein
VKFYAESLAVLLTLIVVAVLLYAALTITPGP